MAKGGSLTTHVLDLHEGRPAQGIHVEVHNGAGERLAQGVTNADGRIEAWHPALSGFGGGVYALTFHTGRWFGERGQACFHPRVRVEFEARDAGRYHIPLLLDRFGYSTYRGS